MADSNDQWSTIVTERLILRVATAEDADAYAALRTNPAIFYWRTPDTHDEAVQWLHDRLADPLHLSYTARLRSVPDVVIGSLGAAPLPEVGYVYDPSVWGKGYATEALRAWIDAYWMRWPQGHPAVDPEKRDVLEAETGPEDDKSPNVLKKCGFTFYGKVQVVEEGKAVMLNRWRLRRPS